MPKQIVAGNWKMNKSLADAIELAESIANGLTELEHYADSIILAPPYHALAAVSSICEDHSILKTGAQNCHQLDSGAYTGEISSTMITSCGAEFVILGHSERRQHFNESDELLTEKVNAALKAGLNIIFCCGESLETREKNLHKTFVTDQLKKSLFHLSKEDFSKIVIAYEPIWAIGTGVTASPEQAQEMHNEIRSFLRTEYSAEIANDISILYGGSCNPKNAAELFALPDVNGGLIGGASLKSEDFLSIIASFSS